MLSMKAGEDLPEGPLRRYRRREQIPPRFGKLVEEELDFREQQATIFQEADRRYTELKRRHEPGEIDDEQFDTERQRLMVYDDEGRWWAKSRKTGA